MVRLFIFWRSDMRCRGLILQAVALHMALPTAVLMGGMGLRWFLLIASRSEWEFLCGAGCDAPNVRA